MMATSGTHTIPEYFNKSHDGSDSEYYTTSQRDSDSEYYSAGLCDSNTEYLIVNQDAGYVDEVVLGSSVLLTPDHTPTKESRRKMISVTPPGKSTRNEARLGVRDKSALSRSHSDSQLDSPRPTQRKQTRSDVRAKLNPQGKPTTAKPPPGRANGRSSRAKNKSKTKSSTVEHVQSKPEKSSKKSSRSHSVPDSRNGSGLTETKVTDYFQVRRSGRMTSKEVKLQAQADLEEKILSGCEDGLEVVEFEGKGRGVIATKSFQKGDFVVEYIGDMVDSDRAKKRESQYSENPEFGCYMYHFKFRNKRYCVDATAESDKLGRLLNHSKLNGNCATKVVGIDDQPYLILVARRNISPDEELTYDYGDRSKEAIEAFPWLAL